ncbi:LAME_0E03818g1_1 [Lachancea meyersii CBS 8951]|uniref:LAME_0E03818g1_1 n=1 Tax=Lachancea meyersii CBS 8951 TaxID=1266667 RepID=A0A1G4JGM1_9SACH|nr:LAME_0E03818g1_1 [Lachancea meyersii CBS 8951]
MKELSNGKNLASKVLTAKALDLAPPAWEVEPKVKVSREDSLFLISYSDAAVSRLPMVLPSFQEFKVSLYIDIPTIDYYNDQLTHNRLSKINKKFKIHKLRERILASITDFEDSVWDSLLQKSSSSWPVSFTFSVASSGALRYVETIKFLIESCWHRIQNHKEISKYVRAVFRIQVSPTSLIWFKTFLNKDLLARATVHFEVMGNYNMITSSTTPFKEYYTKLTEKFTPQNASRSHISKSSKKAGVLDSIIVVTNSTGVKALLTILSDKPLTSYLSNESLNALHSNALQKKPSKPPEVEPTDSEEEETPLKRDSSSLLNFQNSLLTSNKDKSVKVITAPYTRTNSRLARSRSPNVFPSGRGNMSPNRNMTEEEQEQLEPYEDSEEEEEDDEDDDGDDEDGLSFSVPSRLSRCGSETDFSAKNSLEAESTARRFRSLSLMDPALQAPFAQNGSQSQDAPRLQGQGREEPPTMENIEDEMCSPTANRLNQGCSNIYVHDGHFAEQPISTAPKRARRLPRTKSANNFSVGLIPPEFFSRISSPSSSNSSSNTSLSNLNILPGTFSKLLRTPGDASGGEDEEPNLLDATSQRTSKLSPSRFAVSPLAPHDMNRFALNFKASKPIPISAKALDDEDRLMFGSGNPNDLALEEDAKSNPESVSTLVGRNNGAASESPSLNSFNLRIYADEDSASRPKSHSSSVKPLEPAKPAYKKPKFTLDLYNDEETQSNGGWLLGGFGR